MLTVLFPIVVQYSLENDYLKSHYAAADYIPISTQVLSTPDTASLVVNASNGKPLFYLHFHRQDIQRWVPDATMIWLIIAAIVFSVSWLQLIIIRVVRARSSLSGFLITFGILATLRVIIYLKGFPFGLQNLKFFSPSLYASSMLLPSLGDMLLNALSLLWLVIFIVRHVPYRNVNVPIRSKALRVVIAILIIGMVVGYSFGFLNVIRSLVLDSNMSFDLSHFYAINGFTIIGLFTISLITAVSCIIIYLLNIRLNLLLHSKLIKYLLLLVIGVIFLIPCMKQHEDFYYFLYCGCCYSLHCSMLKRLHRCQICWHHTWYSGPSLSVYFVRGSCIISIILKNAKQEKYLQTSVLRPYRTILLQSMPLSLRHKRWKQIK